MESCLYEGVVHHERLTPVSHRFHYRLYLAYLDLDELPGLIRSGIVGESRFGTASFRRCDHFGDPRRSLKETIQDLVHTETGTLAEGPIRVLTPLRCLGYHFSPLTLGYVFAGDGVTVQAVIAAVQNTPWHERHCYVLWDGNRDGSGDPGAHRHRKTFHVSPFMDMDMEYHWRVGVPGRNLEVLIENARADRVLFRAGLHLRRHALSRPALRQMQIRHPFLTARITASIYWQALHLWRKKCPFHAHPKQPSPPQTPPPASRAAPEFSNASSDKV